MLLNNGMTTDSIVHRWRWPQSCVHSAQPAEGGGPCHCPSPFILSTYDNLPPPLELRRPPHPLPSKTSEICSSCTDCMYSSRSPFFRPSLWVWHQKYELWHWTSVLKMSSRFWTNCQSVTSQFSHFSVFNTCFNEPRMRINGNFVMLSLNTWKLGYCTVPRHSYFPAPICSHINDDVTVCSARLFESYCL